MVAQEHNKTGTKLYKCQKCGKWVVADDFNFYFKLCIKCEQKSGNSLTS